MTDCTLINEMSFSVRKVKAPTGDAPLFEGSCKELPGLMCISDTAILAMEGCINMAIIQLKKRYRSTNS